ncbi:MAG: ADP-ribosylglycohydrolase family protein [Bryobacterales bacterium]|nr:ADP-ribosylglycohydrolase family protein [Bryobacterales bacterium]
MRHTMSKAVVTALVLGVIVSYGQPAGDASPKDRLFARIYGSVAGAFIGNAIGEPVEGWTWEKIESTFGFLDKFVASKQALRQAARPIPQRYGPPWMARTYERQVGWTEDGMERYKLLACAVIKKGGRVNVEELAREWIERVDPNKFGYHMGNQDQIIYNLLKAGIPPYDAGRYTPWPGSMGTSKMIGVLGIVNACRPDNAARDALDVTRIKDSQGLPNDYALENAAALASATAEALRPGATVNSVIEAALAQLPNERGARQEVQGFLDQAKKAKDYKDLRVIYAERYKPSGGRFPITAAIEILGGGLASFRLADGRPREAVLNAINIGRDTDCKAYVAAGLAGALRGIEAWPPEWVQTVEKAVLTDTYTVDKRNARQMAEGLYKAALNEHARAKAAGSEVDSLLAK